MKHNILIADDEQGVRELLEELLSSEYNIFTATNGEEAWSILQEEEVDLALLDLRMPGMTGMQVMENISKSELSVVVIFVTADKDLNTAVNAIKLGAFDYVVKPFDNDKITVLVKNALEKLALKKEVEVLRAEVKDKFSFDTIIGKSPEMEKIYNTLGKVASNNSTVLITGDSGTGKELIAKAVHYNSHRKNGPFVAVDCAAIPDTLIENELFGHEKGAYTGAMVRKIGKFELANRGTLFLDEIGNLRSDVQAKLLRVLQEFEIERVGGNQKIKVDIRIIAATNADLEKKITDNSFREDLYYRLNVVNIHLPPLRKRQGDLLLLTRTFLEEYNKEFAKNVKLDNEVMDVFLTYPWPGNVRELKNTIQRLVVMNETGMITQKDMHKKFLSPAPIESESLVRVGMTLEEAERHLIRETLKHSHYNISQASRTLGVTRKTMHNKLDRYPELQQEMKNRK